MCHDDKLAISRPPPLLVWTELLTVNIEIGSYMKLVASLIHSDSFVATNIPWTFHVTAMKRDYVHAAATTTAAAAVLLFRILNVPHVLLYEPL